MMIKKNLSIINILRSVGLLQASAADFIYIYKYASTYKIFYKFNFLYYRTLYLIHFRAIADWMTAPDTQFLLDMVRPDFLLLRVSATFLSYS